MLFAEQIKNQVIEAVNAIYKVQVSDDKISLQPTNADFKGDITLVVFPLLKDSKKSPEQTATAIGEWLMANSGFIDEVNVVKGFLNLVIKPALYTNLFFEMLQQASKDQPQQVSTGNYLVEYSSPNTNKPLHLLYIRNNLLGYSVAGLLKADGKKYLK